MGAKAGAGGLVACPGCGFKLRSRQGEVVCPFCGTAVATAPSPETPRPSRRQAEAESLPGPDEVPLSLADEDDDGSPYAVHGAGAPTVGCPGCRGAVVEGSRLCIHCGLDLATGEKTQRSFEPVRRSWEWGWPLARRLSVFTGLQAVNGFGVLVGILTGGVIESYLFMGVVFAALQAFLLGTYERIDLTRNSRGGVRLTSTWRVCFLELAPKKVIWRGTEGIAVARSYRIRLEDWWMLVILLFHFVVPALIFWWYVIRPERAYAALLKDHGSTDTMLYLGFNEEQARAIGETVHNVTGLPLHANL